MAELVTPADSIAALVLAAGQSRRFGSDKRLAELPGRGTLLAATLATLRPHFRDIHVVIGSDDDAALLGISADIVTLRNPAAQHGMGASLAFGVATLMNESHIRAVAVMLGDMPWIRDATFVALAQRAGEALIVRPTFQGEGGHPVVFGREFWPALCQLKGDSGARHILLDNPAACVEIATADPGILKDVDEPGALGPG
ncbi:nucleotidyltransferase family protein [Halomonas sp. HP20-15]|uniref:nucleotidyltransferase family protein n=1 Tax=Halomonas sp. HP20-15 TaxID=3085901 RepID=UPI002982A9A0|nr:nucleotidyltransferase family protein [Halomonas sp. HP20-15]MDW5378367.1 nucleotidyltransferase family protein [Halomonas sp. HP20-15]